MKIGKDLKPVLEYAEENGWELKRRTERATLVFEKDGCSQVTVSMRTGDPRAVRNMLAMFRRQDRELAHKQMQQTA